MMTLQPNLASIHNRHTPIPHVRVCRAPAPPKAHGHTRARAHTHTHSSKISRAVHKIENSNPTVQCCHHTIAAANFARTRNVPYFGICFGMQMAVLEAARNLAGIKDASSTEFGVNGTPLIGLMTEWMKDDQLETRGIDVDMGGTMRLGAYQARLAAGSKVADIYGSEVISERHRHRYEVNMAYRDQLEATGLSFSGVSPDGLLPEIVEFKDHPWYIGVQYHPELKSRPFEPHPLFSAFIEAALNQSRLV